MWHSALAALLLIGQVSAGVIDDALGVIRRDLVEDSMKRYVDNIVEPIEKRQNGAINATQWDADTMAACTSALTSLNGVASNPSGLAVCYNLPMLDNVTGIFQGDLRIFKIADPIGDFANVPSQNVSVGLSYIGATVSKVNQPSAPRRRDERTSLISWPRGMNKRQQAAAPTMVQSFTFVGRINDDVMRAKKSLDDLQKVLVPTVTLTGQDPSGKQVNTTLSSNEATFVSGFFATVAPATATRPDPPIQTLVVASDKPFVVPGLNILIVPIGGIITGVWAVLFISTIAYGTYGRIQFRENYRSRVARAGKPAYNTI